MFSQDVCDHLLVAKNKLMLPRPHAQVHTADMTLTSVTAHTRLPGYTKPGPRTHLHILQLFSPLTEEKERVKERKGEGQSTETQ